MVFDDGLGDWETCSWCVEEVKWTSLRETSEGNLCPTCHGEFIDSYLKRDSILT